MRASGYVLFALVAISVAVVVGAPLRPVVADEGAPPAGTMRFSTSAEAFPADAEPVATGDDTIYALCGFGKPWGELMSATDKDTPVVVKLYEGNTQKRSATFRPGAAAFAKDTFVLEIAPDPETATQFPYFIVDTLAKYPVGKHALTFELWSFQATTKDKILARGTLTFVATETGRKRLAGLVGALKEARKRYVEAQRAAEAAAAPKPEPDPEPQPAQVKVRHEGADFLQLRGDEIVKDGAVVGSFDGTTVRKGGSIVGEIKGEVFRHEGSEKWKLDRGNMYSGLEIRWEGAIIGSIEKSGRITWEGSEWGNVKPYTATPEETMRIFAALYYFSTYFQRK